MSRPGGMKEVANGEEEERRGEEDRLAAHRIFERHARSPAVLPGPGSPARAINAHCSRWCSVRRTCRPSLVPWHFGGSTKRIRAVCLRFTA